MTRGSIGSVATLLFACAMPLAAVGPQALPDPLSLEDALAFARRDLPAIELAEAGRDASAAALAEAESISGVRLGAIGRLRAIEPSDIALNRDNNDSLLDRSAGSWFFLGELYTDLPLPVDSPVAGHCGSCQACIDVCPTRAIVAPYQVDARRCISYLTIELAGPIPEALRPRLGNRIYGCDDCQQVCPWNRFATPTPEGDFFPRHGLDSATLIELFAWREEDFLTRTEGSAIRRIGYRRWMRNLAVALGNAGHDPCVIEALDGRRGFPDSMVREHVEWALARQFGRAG
jgi:ferredoxin